VPIDVERVRDVTSLPNAEAMGIGPSRRVVLWDTLIDGRFTRPEVTVVIAHELGHLARNHIWKAVGWYALFAFPGAFLIARLTRRRGGMGRAEAVPVALLVLVVLGLLALTLENAISRHTLDEPNPSTFEYLVLENHPTIMQRIAMAQAWRAYSSGR
jgi:STE24 endopeptidase